ncbi:MAG: glycosyltransferase family 2 protein [Nonomuraea sp.]|nr:glycosyltransferase family 2 protein [Nonomuraea sp.]NUP69379.1 glycosyltransferase family 2 protein [Nonomuraea sp.]
MTAWPSVGVVIPTRGDRPGLLREAVEAALTQDYPGPLSIVVVTDAPTQPPLPGSSPALGGPVLSDGSWSDGPASGVPVLPGCLPSEASTRVHVMPNARTPGLPGARNTGIGACSTDLVAFCDDDDVWLPGKLTAQVGALVAGGGEFASCAIEVEHGRHRVPRPAGTETVTVADLVRSRMVMVHSSTFLFRRGSLWVDESAPGGQNEDWDLALRAARRRPIIHVDRPLVRVRWGGTSYYAARWADRIAGLEWMLARHPDLTADPRGAARIYGQLAFAYAALGRRREAARWALRTFRTRPGEPRTPIALAVAARIIPAQTVLTLLHKRGHGI